MSRLLLGAWPLAAALAAAPAPAGAAGARPRGTGAVLYVTATRAYLDAGEADGLAPGAVLELRRGGAVTGRCTVETLADHSAVCTGAGIRVGDTFRFAAAVEPPEPKTLPPPPDDAELARRRAVAEAAPYAQVEFHPQAQGTGVAAAAGAARRTADVAVTYASWNPSGAGSSNAARLDVVIRDAEVADGVTLDVDARAERWFNREAPRFRPGSDTWLYLWQAQVTARRWEGLSLAAGRVMPWDIPGATVFDGAQAGWRLRSGEVGVFGGLVPEPDTTAPTSQRYTGGGYWLLRRTLEGGGVVTQEGRVAVVHSPELGSRGEASLAVRAFVKAFDVSAEAQLGAGGKKTAPAYVDGGRVDVGAHPVAGLSLGGSYRYAGLLWPQSFDPPAVPGRGHAADAYAAWDLVTWLRLGATAGLSKDLESKLDRQWVGPEVTFPRLLGSRGGLALSYLQEVGWLEGESAWATLTLRAWEALRLMVRGGWSHEKRFGVDQDEVAASASATADLSAHLGLRLALYGRGAVSGGGGGSNPTAYSGTATLVASF